MPSAHSVPATCVRCQRGRCVQLPFERVHQREVHEGDRQDAESARSAGDQYVSAGQQMPGLVVEHVRRDATREPWPAHVLLVVLVPVEQGGERELEDRSACTAAVREPDGEAIEEHVRGTLRHWGCRRGARRGGRVPHAHAEPAGNGRRVYGFQVGFARESRIERFEPL